MQYTDFFSKRSGLIILNPLIITFILLSSYPIIHNIPLPFWFIILASFILAIVYLLLQNFLPERVLYYVIFLSNIPLIGAMIYYAGGIGSIFPLLYVLLIILSSLYLFRKGAYIVSLCTVLFLFGMVFIEARVVESPIQELAYRFYIFGLLFLFTGILSGTLSQRYQKRSEEATQLRLTTEEMIHSIPSGIITIDPHGAIVHTNIEEGELRTRVHLHIARYLNDNKTPQSIELKVNERYYVLACARVRGSNAGVGILQDYTDIRALEEKLRISEQTKVMAQLGGALAHEIRNPLASIRGSLEVIREAESDKETLHFINVALKESIRLNDIVTDFLNYAQFTPVRKNPLRINDVISEALADVMQRVDAAKLRIKRVDNDFHVLGDLNKMKSALANIIINAYEASPRGEEIIITSHTVGSEGVIAIRDHGKGIAQGLLQRIFDPFYTSKKGGTGLGLAIVKNIIEAHNGVIEVTSTVDEGTTFYIKLPLAETPV